MLITYDLPFAEVVLDFYDRLKTVSRGYASLDYHISGYWESPLQKLEILVNGDPGGRALGDRAPRLGLHARPGAGLEDARAHSAADVRSGDPGVSIGSRIIARESVKALRKNVLAKCYGGDISRKRKLLEKQKEGKKRMKRVGKVEIPQDAFLAVLKIGTEE